MSERKACCVYIVRALGLDEPVYVGIADDFVTRWRAHLHASWWLGEVVVESVRVVHFIDRETARQMEAALINNLRPRYNTADEAAAFRRFLSPTERRDFTPIGDELFAGLASVTEGGVAA